MGDPRLHALCLQEKELLQLVEDLGRRIVDAQEALAANEHAHMPDLESPAAPLLVSSDR